MNERTHAAISRNCARKPIRSAVTRFSVGSGNRFSASSTRFTSVATQPLATIASAHQADALEPYIDIPPMPPRVTRKNGLRLTMKTKMTMKPAAPNTTPDIARDLDSVDRNRNAAETHSDHMNNTTSEIRIVTKSMPPSRKLIAMNGAIARTTSPA